MIELLIYQSGLAAACQFIITEEATNCPKNASVRKYQHDEFFIQTFSCQTLRKHCVIKSKRQTLQSTSDIVVKFAIMETTSDCYWNCLISLPLIECQLWAWFSAFGSIWDSKSIVSWNRFYWINFTNEFTFLQRAGHSGIIN